MKIFLFILLFGAISFFLFTYKDRARDKTRLHYSWGDYCSNSNISFETILVYFDFQYHY